MSNTEHADIDFPEGIKVVMTCPACPEQYDVFYDDLQIGYLRLRFSWWSVSYPNAEEGRFGGGEDLLGVPYYPDDGFVGEFYPGDRQLFLVQAVDLLIQRHLKEMGRSYE